MLTNISITRYCAGYHKDKLMSEKRPVLPREVPEEQQKSWVGGWKPSSVFFSRFQRKGLCSGSSSTIITDFEKSLICICSFVAQGQASSFIAATSIRIKALA